jgi:hypothetical protein
LKYIKFVSIISIIIVIAAFFASCEKEDNSVIDPVLHIPTVLGTSISPSVYDTSDVKGTAWAEVISEEPIQKATVTIKNRTNAEIGVFELKDDGVAPDTTAGDNKFTGYFNFSMSSCREVGIYHGDFTAQNISGIYSGSVSVPFNVINSNNHPPFISNLMIVPDSIHFGDSAYFIFVVTAIDPDGSCDIKDVHYDGFDPNNQPLTRRGLYDDGSCCIVENFGPSGDTTANDSRFTRRLFGSPTLTGYYRYFIQAIDWSDSSSNVLSDSIYVYP